MEWMIKSIPESKCIFIKTEQTVVEAAVVRDEIRVNQACTREIDFSLLFTQEVKDTSSCVNESVFVCSMAMRWDFMMK
jgi:hypothetical protein